MAASPQPPPEMQLSRKPRVHSRSRCLTKDELDELRNACARAALTPEFGLRRKPGPWDSADGKKITCLLCGVQLGNLGSHLINKHLELLAALDGKVGAAYKQHTFDQGWGRAPINSLNAREASRKRTAEYQERHAHKSRRAATNNVVEIPKSTEWYRDQIQNRDRDRVLRMQRLAKQQAKIPEATKETMISCRLCERDGHPGYRFNTVRGHTQTIHGIPLSKYKRMFPDAATATTRVQGKFDRAANGVRSYYEDRAEARVRELREQLRQAEAELEARSQQRGSESETVLRVDQMIPQFERLFSLVEADPKVLRRYDWSHPGFTPETIVASRDAIGSRRPREEWPKIAAISFVATRDHRDRETVKRAYNRHYSAGKQ